MNGRSNLGSTTRAPVLCSEHGGVDGTGGQLRQTDEGPRWICETCIDEAVRLLVESKRKEAAA